MNHSCKLFFISAYNCVSKIIIKINLNKEFYTMVQRVTMVLFHLYCCFNFKFRDMYDYWRKGYRIISQHVISINLILIKV